MDYFDQLWGTVNVSAELWKQGDHQKALRLLDDAIAYWIQQGKKTSSIQTLCHHAAVLCDSAGNLSLVKHYYGQSLTYSPENPVALYGLAEVALKQATQIWPRSMRKGRMTRLCRAMTQSLSTACST